MCRALGDGAAPALGALLVDGLVDGLGRGRLVGLGAVLDGQDRGGLGLDGRRRRLGRGLGFFGKEVVVDLGLRDGLDEPKPSLRWPGASRSFQLRLPPSPTMSMSRCAPRGEKPLNFSLS